MIFALISDIHSNPWALRAVLDYSGEKYGDDLKIFVLGDMIGYGPKPLETIRLIKSLSDKGRLLKPESKYPGFIAGNHEATWLWLEKYHQISVVLKDIMGIPDPDMRQVALIQYSEGLWKNITENSDKNHDFPSATRKVVDALLINSMDMLADKLLTEWFRDALENVQAGIIPGFSLDNLPRQLTFSHASLDKPLTGNVKYYSNEAMLEYLYDHLEEKKDQRRLIFHGHSHVPFIFDFDQVNSIAFKYDEKIPLNNNHYVINTGSCGMPRDCDPRASFVVVNLEEGNDWVKFHRVQVPEEERKKLIELLKGNCYPGDVVQDFVLARYIDDMSKVNNLDYSIIRYVDLMRSRAEKNCIC